MANHDHFDIRVRALRLNKTLTSLALEINDRGIPCVRQSLSRAIHNEVKTRRDGDIINAADEILKKHEKGGE